MIDKNKINEIISFMKRMGEDIDISSNYYLYLENYRPPVIIEEGLIKSYDISRVIGFMSRFFNLKTEGDGGLSLLKMVGKEETFNGEIKRCHGQNDTETIVVKLYDDSILPKLNYYFKKYGWFNSRIDDNEYLYEKKFDEVIKAFQLLEYTSKLYHITEKKNESNILKKGLRVKTATNQNGYMNGKRIYLFLNEPSDIEMLMLSPRNILIEVDITKLPETYEFYFDPRMKNALYCYENIPLQAIKVIN